MQLRHYGSIHYDRELFIPISDRYYFNKPKGGLWTTPIESKYGWKEWSYDEYHIKCEIYFDIEFNGKVLEINNYHDMELLPWKENNSMYYISYEELCSNGFVYDAIYLTYIGQIETQLTYPKSLYGWGCESVLIMNPDTIREI